MEQLSLKMKTSGQIDEESLMIIVTPHLFGDLSIKFKELLKNVPQVVTNKSSLGPFKAVYQISDVKKIITKIPLSGVQGKFYSALRVLQRILQKTKTPLWELFSSSLQELDRSKRIRTPEFIAKTKNLGLSQERIDCIVSYLSHSNSISLFELLHFAKIAIEALNPS